MNKTDYILLDTKGKTQKANNLQISNDYHNKNYLFDFSLLEKHISDPQVLQEIEKQCFHCSASFQIAFVNSQIDLYSSFEWYTGSLYFKPYIVYSDSKNKRIYTIMKLVNIERLTFESRKSLYDDFKITQEINDHIGHDYYNEDIEIA